MWFAWLAFALIADQAGLASGWFSNDLELWLLHKPLRKGQHGWTSKINLTHHHFQGSSWTCIPNCRAGFERRYGSLASFHTIFWNLGLPKWSNSNTTEFANHSQISTVSSDTPLGDAELGRRLVILLKSSTKALVLDEVLLLGFATWLTILDILTMLPGKQYCKSIYKQCSMNPVLTVVEVEQKLACLLEECASCLKTEVCNIHS